MKCRDCKKELEDDGEGFQLETGTPDEGFHDKFYLCKQCLIKRITGE